MTSITITSAKAKLNDIVDTAKGAALFATVAALQIPKLIGMLAEEAQCKLLGIEEMN